MNFSRVVSLLQKSSVGKLPRKFLYVSPSYFGASFDGRHNCRTMSTVNYIAEYLDKNKYPMLPFNNNTITLNSDFLRKLEDVTPDMIFSQEKRDEFISYFPDLVKQLEIKAGTLDKVDNGKHIAKVFNYFETAGTKYAGLIAAETYRMLLPKSQQTSENIRLGFLLGWCVELFYYTIYMADDIMDGAETRWDKPCWYRLDDVKLAAIADAFIIESGMYYILANNFSHLDCFVLLFQLFNEISYSFSVGQRVEMKYSNDAFNTSIDLYRATVSSASVYITGYLPVILGTALAGYTDPNEIKKAKTILTQLGYYYLIENDYMDCFGDPRQSGKVGRDIQTGRCRWPIVAFMNNASPEQKKLMRAHYGQDNEESVTVVRQLFEDVKVKQIYANYIYELYHRLMKDIEENSYGDLEKVYRKLVEVIPFSLATGGVVL